jgi:hypothetical protein
MPWLIAIVFLLAYEWWALSTHRETLSRMVWNGQQVFPLLEALMAFVVGGLLVHFFWHWCP